MRLSRRTFLKTGAATGIAAGGGFGLFRDSWLLRATATPAAPEPDRDEKWVPSVCLQCPAGCGILVRVVNGRAVKIEGNGLYPSNRGRTCPKGQAGLQVLYDPDRIKGPMQRVAERGSGQWRAIGWDEALDIVTGRLRELRDQGLAHTLVFMNGRNRGQMGPLIERFCQAYGSPNNVGHSSISEDGSVLGHWLSQGWKAYAAYDWENCEYLICFGAGFIEAWRPTAPLLGFYGHMRRGRIGIRAKIVQVETRFSITASKADEWLPINPGTDGALALGLAHVIVREELFDRGFLDEHALGFEDWVDEKGQPHMGFRTLVMRDYTPQQVEKITGIPARQIERIAIEFARKRPHCIAAGARGSSMHSNGAYNRFAIHCLNALVGSIESRGGIMRQIDPPFTPYAPPALDDLAQNSLAQGRLDYAGTARYPVAGNLYQDIPDRILSQEPYPVNALLCYYTNPMFSSPQVDRWKEAISKVPFVVTFSPFMDETTAHADIILPDHTYLERWQDDVIYPSLGFPVWGLRQPAVKPVYNTMNSGDVLIEVARRLGGTVARSFPWQDFRELIMFRARGVFETGGSSIAAGSFEGWWEAFRNIGAWAHLPYPYASENPGQWKRALATPSGKFEFFSQSLKAKLEHLAEETARAKKSSPEHEMGQMLTALRLQARGDEVFLAHYEPARFVGDEREYPFYFNTYKLMTHAEGRGANQPMLQSVLGLQLAEKWSSWVELNPHTAASLGIRDNDWVYVESVVGRIRVRARIHPGAMPNVVSMPFEHGHQLLGRWASQTGVNPNHIIANEYDHLGGLAAWFSTRVKVYTA